MGGPLVGVELLAQSTKALRRLRLVRGASRRTARRIAQATAVVALALGLLGIAPLAEPADALSIPNFAATSTNPFGLADIGSYAAPTFADIDNDGDLDAFIGNSNGTTIFFLNTGSATAPAFAAPSPDPFGLTDVGSYAVPTFADIDGDGDLDAFVGNAAGNTIFFLNTGSATAPAFAAAAINPFGLAGVGSYAAPSFVDIDGDGDLDAFIGNGGGNTIFFRNTGSATAPAFATASTNPFGLTNVGYYATPRFADIDGDGDLDAFIGEEYVGTIFFRNTGSATAPAFAAASTNPFGLIDVGDYAVPALVDIDGDGDFDAFIGEVAGNTIFFRNDATVLRPPMITRGVVMGSQRVLGTGSLSPPPDTCIEICLAAAPSMPSLPPCTGADTLLGSGGTNAAGEFVDSGGLPGIPLATPLANGECVYAFDQCQLERSAVTCAALPVPLLSRSGLLAVIAALLGSAFMSLARRKPAR